MADGTLTPPESDWSKRIKAAIAPKSLPDVSAAAANPAAVVGAFITKPSTQAAIKRVGEGYTAPLPDKAVPEFAKPVERALAAPEGSRRADVAKGMDPVTGLARDLTNPATYASTAPIVQALINFMSRGLVSQTLENPVRAASEFSGYGPLSRSFDAAGNVVAEKDPAKALGAGLRAATEGSVAALTAAGNTLAAKETIGAVKRVASASRAAKAAKVPATAIENLTTPVRAKPAAQNDNMTPKQAEEAAIDQKFWSDKAALERRDQIKAAPETVSDPQYSRGAPPKYDVSLKQMVKEGRFSSIGAAQRAMKRLEETGTLETRPPVNAGKELLDRDLVAKTVRDIFNEKGYLPRDYATQAAKILGRNPSTVRKAIFEMKLAKDERMQGIPEWNNEGNLAAINQTKTASAEQAPVAPKAPLPEYEPGAQTFRDASFRDREVLTNPGASAVGRMVRDQKISGQANPVRYWVDEQGNAHVWNSDFGALHDDVAAALKINPEKAIKGTLETPDDLQEFNLAVRNARRKWAADNGYSRGEFPGLGSSVEDLTKAVRDSWGANTKRLMRAGRVRVVESVDDLPPLASGEGHPRDAKALYDRNSGMTWVVADNTSLSEAKGIVLHEIGEHHGLKDMLGDRYGALTDQMKKLRAAGNKDVVAAYERAQKNAARPDQVDSEAIAYLLEAKPNAPISVKIIQAIREWFNRNFGTVKSFMRGREVNLSTEDIRQLGVASLRRAARKEAEFASPARERAYLSKTESGTIRTSVSPGSKKNAFVSWDYANNRPDENKVQAAMEASRAVKRAMAEDAAITKTPQYMFVGATRALDKLYKKAAKSGLPGYKMKVSPTGAGDFFELNRTKNAPTEVPTSVGTPVRVPNMADKDGVGVSTDVDPMYAFGAMEDKAARQAWASGKEVKKETFNSDFYDDFRKKFKPNYAYTFPVGESRMRVEFNREPISGMYDVTFYNPDRGGWIKFQPEPGILGKKPGEGFGKIAAILERFAEEHGASSLKFTGANDRLSRLYSRMLLKLTPEGWSAWDISNPRVFGHQFIIAKGKPDLKAMFGRAEPLTEPLTSEAMKAKEASVRATLGLPSMDGSPRLPGMPDNFSFSRGERGAQNLTGAQQTPPARTTREKIADFLEGKSPPRPEPKTPQQHRARGMEKIAELVGGTAGGAAGGAVAANSMIVETREAKKREEAERIRRAADLARIDNQVKTFRFERDNPVEAIPEKTTLDEKISRIAKRQAVPAEFLNALVKKESGGDPEAQASTSSAVGATQFIEGTWKKVLAEDPESLGFRGDPNSPEALELRKDPRWAVSAAAVHAKKNAEMLAKALGRDPTQGEVYVAHFLGIDGAKKALKADPEAIAAKLLPAAAGANENVFYVKGDKSKPRTVRQVIELQTKGFSKEPFKVDAAEIGRKVLKQDANPREMAAQ